MPKEPISPKGKRFEHIILPEVETLLSIQTAPNAVCHLRHDEVKDHHLQLDADDRGVVRFHAKAPKGSQTIELHLDCTGEDGKKTTYTIALRGDTCPGAQTSANEAEALSAGKERAPLHGDLLALSSRELVKRGYPPRPDPAMSPARYARWARRVSQPFTLVKPRQVPHPGVSFAGPRMQRRPQLPPKLASPTLPLPPPIVRSMFNASSNTWSGAFVTNPAAQFFWIEADWRVPGVFSVPNGPIYSAAAEWIGLDNSGTDLFQAGTDSECFYFFGWTFTNYWMWIETLPFAPWGLPNFPISPGDSVSVDIFVADQYGNTWFQNESNGGLTPADNNVWFMIYNYSKGLSYWGTLPTGPENLGGLQSTGYTGTAAEFIVERPTDLNSGNPYPLALFGLAVMDSCWYGDSEYGLRPWRLGADGSTPFDGNLTYLNMQDSANLLALPISLPDPTSPGGYEIMWLWVNYQ